MTITFDMKGIRILVYGLITLSNTWGSDILQQILYIILDERIIHYSSFVTLATMMRHLPPKKGGEFITKGHLFFEHARDSESQPSRSSQIPVSHFVDKPLSNLSLLRFQGHCCICTIAKSSRSISNTIVFQMENDEFHQRR